MHNGFISIEFSANLAVIKTRPGYASSLAYDIDNRNFDEILDVYKRQLLYREC